MELNYKTRIPASLSDESRVWIYQADRSFSGEEAVEIEKQLLEFNEEWSTHGAKVQSFTGLLFDRFIVIISDETVLEISGCGIDSSTSFIRHLEEAFKVSLFNRQELIFWVDGRLKMFPLQNLESEFSAGRLTGDTIYFDNTILTKGDLLSKWKVPVRNSWLAKRIHF